MRRGSGLPIDGMVLVPLNCRDGQEMLSCVTVDGGCKGGGMEDCMRE